MKNQTMVKKFDRQSKTYDKRRGNDPTDKYRERIIPEVEGKVLEVGIGAGGNFPYYEADIELTGVDFSPKMINAAQEAASAYPFEATLYEADIAELDFDENSFDTIVSTLSFCAYEHPDDVLANFAKWCRPEGTILMMEHGESTNRLLAGALNIVDPVSMKVLGCHQNRNISEIVRHSDLKIVKEERHLAGCLYMLWVKP
ncbi:class I SAM-dependent methyltransferase [Salinicoccus roseus]|uniref:class I SAM-dependent methyltransferase n=1 Tax=Salinicoccus roseus TaxID=45670 RepID=UPI0023007CCA|nr:class I SAM-dependent methyltransferase [Salinicoccus roseus]